MKKHLLFFALLFVYIGNAQVPSYVPTNGLVGYWPFSGNANDASSNGNNGTVYGAALTNDRFGNPNSAYTFNGSSDYIDLYSTTNILNTINGLLQFSVSYWAFIPTNSAGCIWGHWSNNSGGVGINCGLKSSFVNGVGFSASNYSGCCEFVQTSFTAFNAWSHVVVVFDSTQLLNSDIIKTYVNGQIISYSSGGIANTPLGNGTSLFIGRRNIDFNNFGDYFLGSVDEIGIWNRALTQAEITTLYTTLSTEQIPANNQIKVYPNPAKEQITIDFGNTSNIIGGNFRIINTLGQEVLNGVLSSQQNIIQLNNVKGQGVYFVKIYDSSNSMLGTKKIIIQQ
jgi:hypothetical protein